MNAEPATELQQIIDTQDTAAQAVLNASGQMLYDDLRQWFAMTPAQALQTVIDIRTGRMELTAFCEQMTLAQAS